MVRYDVSQGVCYLRLDAPPVNAITLDALAELRRAVGRANADEAVRGIVILGDQRHFSAGADIGLFERIAGPDDARRISRAFQEAFAEVENSRKPVVAALAGNVMGGAVELAAACHLRVGTDATRMNMPEVNLGINPGGGGTQRLPRLMGPGPALEMMLSGRPLGAEAARAAGLLDAVCSAQELVETAARLALSTRDAPKTRDRTEKVGGAASVKAALAEADTRLAGFHPEILGPRKVVEAVRMGLEESFEAGLHFEREAFAECMESPAAKNKIYVFFATRQTSKMPDLPDRQAERVARAAVVGMGSMGSGIAQTFLAAGVPVSVYDADPKSLERGLERIHRSFEKRVVAGRLDPGRAEAMLGMIRIADGLGGLADAPLVVEAVFEDAEVKRALLGELETACGDDAILASNTSTISLATLAAGLKRPERLVGMHFFNPAHHMPLVEVIYHDATSPAVTAVAMQTAKHLRKTPVLVRNREGFLVNRLFIPYMKEAFRLLEEGADTRTVDHAMTAFGMPMGPFALIDMAGIDVLASTDRVMNRAFPRHGTLSPIAARLVEQGRLGQKTGAGVYDYQPGDRAPHRSPAVEAVIAELQRPGGMKRPEISPAEIADRLVLRMAVEALWVLQEKIAQRESDLDVATVLGIGFPDFRGGVLRYARSRGADRLLADLEQLANRQGERFQIPTPNQEDLP